MNKELGYWVGGGGERLETVALARIQYKNLISNTSSKILELWACGGLEIGNILKD